MEILSDVFQWATRAIVAYMTGISLIYFVMMILGFFALRRYHGRLLRSERDALFRSSIVPRISVLVPAHDESETILDSVKALLTLRYPNHEVVVVNDGSNDDTLERLVEEFRLYRSSRVATGSIETSPVRGVYESRDPIPLVVVDKEKGGKGDALNAGLNHSRASIVGVVDADSILEPDSLLHVMKPFLSEGEPGDTVATGGIVRVANGCRVEHGRVVEVGAPRSVLAAFQAVEYLRAFLGGRIAYSFLNSLLVISGAFGVFRRRAVLDAGGFLTETVGEDMELVVRLHHELRGPGGNGRPNGRASGGGEDRGEGYRIVFVPEPVSWTEAPESLRVLGRQRSRWQRGLVESLWTHRRMMLNPRYGMVGMFAFPYFLLFEMLGPTVELAGYALTVTGLALGFVPPPLALLFFLVSVGFGVLLSLSSLLLEELTVRRYRRPSDVARLFLAAIVENFGLRQLLAVWRTKAIVDAIRGDRSWGKMERAGFEKAKRSALRDPL